METDKKHRAPKSRWWMGRVKCTYQAVDGQLCGAPWAHCTHLEPDDVQRVGRRDEAMGRTFIAVGTVLVVTAVAGCLKLLGIW